MESIVLISKYQKFHIFSYYTTSLQSVYYSIKSCKFRFYKEPLYLYQYKDTLYNRKQISFISLYRMIGSLSKKWGAHNVSTCHTENLENEIKETIANFEISNSRYWEKNWNSWSWNF